jgi:hypothetical protein
MEIIHLVEHSELSITKTCAELDVARSTFYRWYCSNQEEGFDGLMDRKPGPRQFCLPWWARPGEPDPCTGQRPDCRAGSGPSGEIPPADCLAFHRSSGLFRLGIERLSHPEGLRPDPESGLPDGACAG